MFTPGGDLLILDELLTHCAGTLRAIAFTIYKLAIFRWFLVGKDSNVVWRLSWPTKNFGDPRLFSIFLAICDH